MTPDPASPVDAVTEAWPRGEREWTEYACEDMGHAYAKDGADPIHGVCGMCQCGSRLYTLTGQVIEP